MGVVTRDLHQFPDTLLIDGCEWVILYDFQLLIMREETAGIVTAHAKSRLGKVIRAKAEKLRIFGKFIRHQGASRNLEHCADQVVEFNLLLLRDLFRYLVLDAVLAPC
jgi:hypothetical protein